MPIVDSLTAPIHEPIPPTPYSHWVWVSGVALVVAIIAWYWWVRHHTRPRPAPDLPQSHWVSLREKTLKKVDEVETRYRNGHVDLRELHLELNTILRVYATERLGQDAMWMSALEIKTFPGAQAAAQVLSDFEEPAFAYDTDAQALAGVEELRKVIHTW